MVDDGRTHWLFVTLRSVTWRQAPTETGVLLTREMDAHALFVVFTMEQTGPARGF